MKEFSLYRNGREISIVRLLTGLTIIFVLIGSAFTEKNYKSTCETIPSEIHITKGNQTVKDRENTILNIISKY